MILIVDDDSAVRLSLRILLRRQGYETCEASSPEEAVALVRSTAVDLVLLDMNYSRKTSGEEGLILLRQIKIFRPEAQVILMTAWGSIPLAVEGIHAGAFDFITKPWDNQMLLGRIKVALELNSDAVEASDSEPFDRSLIIGRSPALSCQTGREPAPQRAPSSLPREPLWHHTKPWNEVMDFDFI